MQSLPYVPKISLSLNSIRQYECILANEGYFWNLRKTVLIHFNRLKWIVTDDITPETPFSGENVNDVYIENYVESEEGSHQEYYQNTGKNEEIIESNFFKQEDLIKEKDDKAEELLEKKYENLNHEVLQTSRVEDNAGNVDKTASNQIIPVTWTDRNVERYIWWDNEDKNRCRDIQLKHEHNWQYTFIINKTSLKLPLLALTEIEF